MGTGGIATGKFYFSGYVFVARRGSGVLEGNGLAHNSIMLAAEKAIKGLTFCSSTVPFSRIQVGSKVIVLQLGGSDVYRAFFVRRFGVRLRAVGRGILDNSTRPRLPVSAVGRVGLLIPPLRTRARFTTFMRRASGLGFRVGRDLRGLRALGGSLVRGCFKWEEVWR